MDISEKNKISVVVALFVPAAAGLWDRQQSLLLSHAGRLAAKLNGVYYGTQRRGAVADGVFIFKLTFSI